MRAHRFHRYQQLPDERMQFTLGMYGDGDFFNMKGVVEEFFEKIGMKGREKYDPNAGKSFFHPGRQANIIYDGKVVCCKRSQHTV